MSRLSLLLVEALDKAGSKVDLNEAGQLCQAGAELVLRSPIGISRLSRLEQSSLIIGLEYLRSSSGLPRLYGYDICALEHARFCLVKKPEKWCLSRVSLGGSAAVLVQTTEDTLAAVPASEVGPGTPATAEWIASRDRYVNMFRPRACYLLVVRTTGEQAVLPVDDVRALLAAGRATLCVDMDDVLSVFAPQEAELVLRAVEGQPQKCNPAATEGRDLRLLGSRRRFATLPGA